MLVKQYMTQDPVCVSKGTPLDEAWKTILDHSFRQMPVCEEDRLVGIINRTDLLRWNPNMGKEVQQSATPTVGDVMTPDPVTVRATDPIERAISIMHSDKIGSLPVVDADRLVGMLTRTDVFALLAQLFGIDESAQQYRFTEETFSDCLDEARERASLREPISFIAFREPGSEQWQNVIGLLKQDRSI
jgi:acetoin utilization protein AcuB